MRRIRSILLIVGISFLLTNCNKGVNDDSLKLLTRVNQISQTWKVVEFTLDGENKLVQSTPFVINTDDCKNLDVMVIDSSDWTYTFGTDGLYGEHRTTSTFRVSDLDSISVECQVVLEEGEGETKIERSGFWQFNEEKKKADQLFLYDIESNYSVLWQIEELSGSILELSRIYKTQDDEFVEEMLSLRP